VRRAAKIDDNQPEIVRALRGIGCTVQSLAAVGKGCPDLLVGVRGTNILMEVKDGSKPPSRQRLTELEQGWHDKWDGQVATVTSVEDAVQLVLEVR
jgi:hypothetical protein